MMTLDDIMREKTLTEIISDRDSMILQLAKELNELKAKLKETDKKEEDK